MDLWSKYYNPSLQMWKLSHRKLSKQALSGWARIQTQATWLQSLQQMLSAPLSYPFSNQLSVQAELMGQTSHPALAQPWEWAPPSIPQPKHLTYLSLVLDLLTASGWTWLCPPGLVGQVWGQIRSARELMSPGSIRQPMTDGSWKINTPAPGP